MRKIKEILIKLNDWKFIILIIILIGGAFYWFQVRPSNFKRDCFDYAKNLVTEKEGSGDEYDFYYKVCLQSKGM